MMKKKIQLFIFQFLAISVLYGNSLYYDFFDEGMGGWDTVGDVSLSTGKSFKGEHSLKLVQDKDGAPAIARKSIDFEPLQRLHYSAQVLAPDEWLGYSELEDYGLILELAWYDSQGNQLGRAGALQNISPSAREPGKWARIGGRLKHEKRAIPVNGDTVSALLPIETDRLELILRLSPGTSGTFHVDMLSVETVPAPLLIAEIVEPTFKRELISDEESSIRIKFMSTQLKDEVSGEDLRVYADLYGPNDHLLERRDGLASLDFSTVDFKIDATSPKGVYTVEIALVPEGVDYNERLQRHPQFSHEEGNALEGRRFLFYKREVSSDGITLDVRNPKRVLLNGDPTFFTVLYKNTSVSSENIDKALLELEHIAPSGVFDAVMNYGITNGDFEGIRRYLDKANEVGLSVIFSVKDIGLGYGGYLEVPARFDAGLTELSNDPAALLEEIVNAFKDHPAVAGWYLSDEDSIYKLKRINNLYELITRLDPNNPVFVAYMMKDFPYYKDTGDVVGMHRYPVGAPRGYKYGFRSVYERTKEARAVIDDARPLSYGVQICDYNAFQKDLKSAFPTQVELRNMMYQSLIGGAEILYAYSYSYMIRGYRQMGVEELPNDEQNRRFDEVVVPVFRELKSIQNFLIEGKRIADDAFIDNAEDLVVGGWIKEDECLILASNTSRFPIEVVVDLTKIEIPFEDAASELLDVDGHYQWTIAPYETLCLKVDRYGIKAN